VASGINKRMGRWRGRHAHGTRIKGIFTSSGGAVSCALMAQRRSRYRHRHGACMQHQQRRQSIFPASAALPA